VDGLTVTPDRLDFFAPITTGDAHISPEREPMPINGWHTLCAAASGAALIAACALGLTACGGTSAKCQSYNGTPTGAVNLLLDAAQADRSDQACAVTEPMNSKELQANMTQIRAFLETAGGRSKVTVREDRDQQMGSSHWVIATAGATGKTLGFAVYDDDGGMFVDPLPQTTYLNTSPVPSDSRTAATTPAPSRL
jgi:hypothetical protein